MYTFVHMGAVLMELRGAGFLGAELQEIVNYQMWVLRPKLESFARAVLLTADPRHQSSNVLQLEYCCLTCSRASHPRSLGGLSHTLLAPFRRRGTRDIFTCLRM